MRSLLLVLCSWWALAGCNAGEFGGWPQNCKCSLSRAAVPPKVVVRCADASGNGRGLAVGVPDMAHVQTWSHGSLMVLRAGQADAYANGLEALTEFATRTDHGGVQQYPVGIHRAFFPATMGIEQSGSGAVDLAESRLEGATFWCEDSDAP